MHRKIRSSIMVVSGLALAAMACRQADPAGAFIREMDAQPADQRPPDWERTKRLLARSAPRVGEAAPDFTLASYQDGRPITCSAYRASRPLVLIFGSYT